MKAHLITADGRRHVVIAPTKKRAVAAIEKGGAHEGVTVGLVVHLKEGRKITSIAPIFEDESLTRTEAAKSLGFSLAKLDRLKRDGSIEHFKQGHTVRFTPSAVEAYRQSNTVKKAEPTP